MEKQQISTAGPSQRRSLLDLPPELLRKILSFIPYDDASNDRLVCRTFDSFCKQYLNAGIKNVKHYQNRSLQIVKSQLPRRESQRRNHSLARHYHILIIIESRLSMLSMTYNNYIDLSLCCFIPGKVLDEALRVLRLINNTINNNTDLPPQPPELYEEFKDISSMAMEHFKEQVEPGLRNSAMREQTTQLMAYKKDVASMRATESRTDAQLRQNSKKIQEQARLLDEQNKKMDEMVLVRLAPASTQSAPPCTTMLEKLQIRLREQTTQLMVYKKDVASMRATESRTDAQLQQNSKKIQEQAQLLDEQNKKMDEMGKQFKQKLADLTGENNNGKSSVDSNFKSPINTPRRSTRIKSRNAEKNDTVPELNKM